MIEIRWLVRAHWYLKLLKSLKKEEDKPLNELIVKLESVVYPL